MENTNTDSPIRDRNYVSYASAAIALALLAWFYCFQPGFGREHWSAFAWLISSWNGETDYEHAWMVPILSAVMLVHAWKSIRDVPGKQDMRGLAMLAFGALLYVVSFRTLQGRIAIGALPFILTGGVWFLYGEKIARLCAFPFFFLWMMIPLPGFQQATVGLQLLATQAAHWGAGLFGVQTIVEGTNISSASGNWDTYSIAGGCSGIRSLMALIMISTAWAYLAPLAMWKKIVLACSAVPLAIVGNAFRVTSIFVLAEYVNPAFASKTWHDWSGLLFFFPMTLVLLTLLHGVLAGEFPLLKRRRSRVMRIRQASPDQPSDHSPNHE